MTDIEMGAIKKLFNKCLEVNLKGKAYVYFQLTSGPDTVTISIYSPCEDIKSYYFLYEDLLINRNLKSIERELNKWI